MSIKPVKARRGVRGIVFTVLTHSAAQPPVAPPEDQSSGYIAAPDESG